MRKQEFEKLKKLASYYDQDWMEYDFEAQGYDEIKEAILRRARVKTKQMEDNEFLAWEGLAQNFDQIPFEQRVVIPEGYMPKIEFTNCLVLQFTTRDFDFALRVLMHKFKGNFMRKTDKIIEANKQVLAKHRVLWLMGHRKVTDMMLTELEKHQIRPRILRNSYLRRDFLHYADGQILSLSKRQFKELKQKQSIKEMKTEEKIIAKLYA